MAASSSISLTEELFNLTQLNKYKETIEPIKPGSGLPENMFEGSPHAVNYDLDTCLAFKVTKWKQGKTTKTKKVINPNVMFTAFGVFCDKSPGVIRKLLCEWISDNLEKFKQQCFMGMACKDIDFDDWFTNIKRNDTVCDEFRLSGLYQTFQWHALMIMSNKIWTTIPASYGKSLDEIRRLCDIHFLFMCRDTYSCLTPKFEWKHVFPIGEVELLPDPEGPLQNITEKTLDEETNNSNIIKVEPMTDDEVHTDTGTNAPNITSSTATSLMPSTNDELPDAMQNLLVPLPLDTELNFMDATTTFPDSNQPVTMNDSSTLAPLSQVPQPSKSPVTIPCSIPLTDILMDLVDGKMIISTSQVPLEPEVFVEKREFNLRDCTDVITPKTRRPQRKAKRDVNYKIADLTSEEDERTLSDSERMNNPTKSAPSGYRLTTNKYMLAKCKGLIQGPTTRTKALKIEKVKENSTADSDITIDYLEEPPAPKRKRHSTAHDKIKKPGKLITKRYYLRRDGKGTSRQSRQKPKRKHRFKCSKCESYCPSVKALNAHFKLKHRKLQCKKCGKFFPTPGVLKLHSYVHVDGQFECATCKKTFPFKSQLNQHLPSHSDTRSYSCPEQNCDKSFSHEHDLKKHVKCHSGEVHYCTRCDYSNPDERLLNQHMNSHLWIKKYFCKNCKEGFIYSNQLKRHYDKRCQ